MFTTIDFLKVNSLAEQMVKLNRRTYSARYQVVSKQSCSETLLFPYIFLGPTVPNTDRFSEGALGRLALRPGKAVSPNSAVAKGAHHCGGCSLPPSHVLTLVLFLNSRWKMGFALFKPGTYPLQQLNSAILL